MIPSVKNSIGDLTCVIKSTRSGRPFTNGFAFEKGEFYTDFD
ncbi:hypothetical protein C943_00666 [Mariniradius saccharolyticus AK6]|uniref:Uncharacterized protein n=1 Tax=Mariniradius saccharolyticus AK6 TaxID=1239962 RepID=M7XFU4_9BACT|nr:hypothetical protein C943_00666 [Mariniradius saccharolyticus AK6]